MAQSAILEFKLQNLALRALFSFKIFLYCVRNGLPPSDTKAAPGT